MFKHETIFCVQVLSDLSLKHVLKGGDVGIAFERVKVLTRRR